MADDTEDIGCVDVVRSLGRISTPHGIEVTRTVELGGIPQVVSIRGKDRANPVVVFVHGGPGTPLAPTAWMWQRPLEDFFTVVHYDQRGAGRSTRLTDEDIRATMTVDRYKTLELAKVGVDRGWVQEYGGFAAYRSDCDYYMDGTAVSPDYDADDAASSEAGNQLTAEVLVPTLLDIDLSTVHEFPVPIVQFLGRHDLMTPAEPVVAWMERLAAPSKAVEWFEHSAHMAMYEEPGHFLVACSTI